MQPFAKRLYQLMNETGVSQYALGKAIGVARQSIAQYLDGNTQPNAEKICAIADFFGVSTDYLLGRVEYRSTNIEIQGICEKTGLSESTIKLMMDFRNDRGFFQVPENESYIQFVKEMSKDGEDFRITPSIAHLNFLDFFIKHMGSPLLAINVIRMAVMSVDSATVDNILAQFKDVLSEDDLQNLRFYMTDPDDMFDVLKYKNITLFNTIMTDIIIMLSGKGRDDRSVEEAKAQFMG